MEKGQKAGDSESEGFDHYARSEFAAFEILSTREQVEKIDLSSYKEVDEAIVALDRVHGVDVQAIKKIRSSLDSVFKTLSQSSTAPVLKKSIIMANEALDSIMSLVGQTESVKCTTTNLDDVLFHYEDRNLDQLMSSFSTIKTSSINSKDVALKFQMVAEIIEGCSKGNDSKDIDCFNYVQEMFIKDVLGKQDQLPSGYLYFGDDNSAENLSVFLKTNPLFASALLSAVSEDGFREFEIKSSQLPSNWFCRVVGTLDKSYTRVDAKFNANMELIYIRSYKASDVRRVIFEWTRGAAKKKIDEDAGIDKACAELLFLLGFHSQTIHILLHIFHNLLNYAIVGAQLSNCQFVWSNVFVPSVAEKYSEVYDLACSLLFGCDLMDLRTVLRQILQEWLHCRTAKQFIVVFLLKDVLTESFTISDLASMKVLDQFLAHSALALDYADELCSAFEAADPGSVNTCSAGIRQFFHAASKDHDLAGEIGLNTWIQLHSVTGIMHGATLSYSRLLCTRPMAVLYHPYESLFTAADSNILTTLLSSMVGVVEGHHVFSNQMHSWFGRYQFSPQVAHIVDKYALITNSLKMDYLASLQSNSTYFKRFGWILSDYCPDGVDGKQLTQSAYI